MSAKKKRQSLIKAVMQVMDSQGTHRTALAEAAQPSGGSLGNISFTTKHALFEAGIKALVCLGRSPCNQVMSYGDPDATLCLKREKEEDGGVSSEHFALQVDWAQRRFCQLDGGDEVRSAGDLLTNRQRISLRFQSPRSPDMFESKFTRLDTWLDEFTVSQQAALSETSRRAHCLACIK